jgi:hypothetical protein
MDTNEHTHRTVWIVVLTLIGLIGGYAVLRLEPWAQAEEPSNGSTMATMRDVIGRPIRMASGVHIQARRRSDGDVDVRFSGTSGQYELTLGQDASFHASADAPNTMLVHHRYSARRDELIVVRLTDGQGRTTTVPHRDTGGYTHVRYTPEQMDSGGTMHLLEHHQDRHQPTENRWRKVRVRLADRPGEVQVGPWQKS